MEEFIQINQNKVNNNAFTVYLESLSSYDGSLTFKENIDLYSRYMVQELTEMDLSLVDSDVLAKQYKEVILGENPFDGTINWSMLHSLYCIIKSKMETEFLRRIQSNELTAKKDEISSASIGEVAYDWTSLNEDTTQYPRLVVCVKENGKSIEHKTVLFQATAINMSVRYLLGNAEYTSDSLDHRVAGVDASNIGIVAMVAESELFTIYLPHEISREQLNNLLCQCIKRDNYRFKVVHDGVVYGTEENLDYLEALSISGRNLVKKEDDVKLVK